MRAEVAVEVAAVAAAAEVTPRSRNPNAAGPGRRFVLIGVPGRYVNQPPNINVSTGSARRFVRR